MEIQGFLLLNRSLPVQASFDFCVTVLGSKGMPRMFFFNIHIHHFGTYGLKAVKKQHCLPSQLGFRIQDK